MTTKSAAPALGAPLLLACLHGSPELPKSGDSGNLALNRLAIHCSKMTRIRPLED